MRGMRCHCAGLGIGSARQFDSHDSQCIRPNPLAKLNGDHITVMPQASQFNKAIVSFSVRQAGHSSVRPRPASRATGAPCEHRVDNPVDVAELQRRDAVRHRPRSEQGVSATGDVRGVVQWRESFSSPAGPVPGQPDILVDVQLSTGGAARFDQGTRRGDTLQGALTFRALVSIRHHPTARNRRAVTRSSRPARRGRAATPASRRPPPRARSPVASARRCSASSPRDNESRRDEFPGAQPPPRGAHARLP